jgi:hypothetical protein
MKTFGKYVPLQENTSRGANAFAVFTRGIQAGLGHQWKFGFPNGYQASVIDDGYGHESGRYELAVMHEGSIVYDTPVTDDVLGFLSEDEVVAALDQIAALPARSEVSA